MRGRDGRAHLLLRRRQDHHRLVHGRGKARHQHAGGPAHPNPTPTPTPDPTPTLTLTLTPTPNISPNPNPTPNQVAQLTHHTDVVYSLLLAGGALFSSSADKTIRRYDTARHAQTLCWEVRVPLVSIAQL